LEFSYRTRYSLAISRLAAAEHHLTALVEKGPSLRAGDPEFLAALLYLQRRMGASPSAQKT
jgi:hypothetical protein